MPWKQKLNDRFELFGSNDYELLQCMGCNDVKLELSDWFSEITDEHGNPKINRTVYPPTISRVKPKWLDYLDSEWHITKLIEECYAATYNNAPTLAAMGIRAIIEAVMIDKVTDQGSFVKNLQEFFSQGFISKIQKDSLESALEIGHATIHRGHIASEAELETAFDITEGLLNDLYVSPSKAKALRTNLPKRKT